MKKYQSIFIMCLSLIIMISSTTASAKDFSMKKNTPASGVAQNQNTYFDVGIGAMLVPFSSYKTGFSFGIEGGERVYYYQHSIISVGLGIDYYPISKSGTTTSPQTGTINYDMTGYALPVLLKGTYTYLVNERINVYAGIGAGLVASKINTSISGFSSVSEQSSSFAFSIYPGVRINKLGPGALFAEFDFLSATVDYLTAGSANIGGMLFLIGYNIFF